MNTDNGIDECGSAYDVYEDLSDDDLAFFARIKISRAPLIYHCSRPHGHVGSHYSERSDLGMIVWDAQVVAACGDGFLSYRPRGRKYYKQRKGAAQ